MLPDAVYQPMVDGESRRATSPIAHVQRGQGVRGIIVVAEDDSATRMLLRKILSNEHFTVFAVENGALACEAVRRERPDIVLLDWLMPVMDGCEALAELKADKTTRGIPVVMLTTIVQVEERLRAFDAGAQDFVTKPFEPRELVARIEQQLHWRDLLAKDAEAAFERERIALLTASERRYRSLAQAMPPMVWTSNVGGKILFQNASWSGYTGVSVDHVGDGSWSSVLHPDDRTFIADAWANSLLTGESHEVAVRFRRASDGSYRWHIARGTPVRDAMGVIVEWIGSCTDIEDFKLAAESREILDAIQNIILIRNGQGFVDYVNPQWSDYTGAPTDLALGFGWRSFVHPDDVEDLKRGLTNAQDCSTNVDDCEMRVRGRNGTYRWFLSRTAALPAKAGVPGRWLASATDINDAKDAQIRLVDAYDKEKRIADTLQAAFVPKALPMVGTVSFHAAYVPASNEAQIGGDWYDAFELNDGRILFSIGDVGGHGVQAAIAMSCARQAIITAGMAETDPATVLGRVNGALLLQDLTMATAVCGYIDIARQQISYATAGHPPPILANPHEEPCSLAHDGMPLGIMPDVVYTTFTVAARPGAIVVLCTDGVLEHKRNILDGERRLLDATKRVVAERSRNPAVRLHEMMFLDAVPADDAAIMTISFLDPSDARDLPENAAQCSSHTARWPVVKRRFAPKGDKPSVESQGHRASVRGP